jgi:exoribonuclease-2
MNVFYEEQGEFKVGAILADNDTSLQVEHVSGKRVKIKAASVLLRFTDPSLSAFMPAAQTAAETLDADFLWEVSGEGEFSFESLATEYHGRAPTAVEAAGLLLKLHSVPMYFYRRGKGRFKAAPEESLKAALASVEKKRLQAEQQQRYVDDLIAGRTPPEFVEVRDRLLFRPDRNTLEVKALEAACEALKLTPVKVLERAGAIPSTHDYHLGKFLFENFPEGTGFEAVELPAAPTGLPEGLAPAYSIDDASTTEIDDAFSLRPLPGGRYMLGVHIAAPALGIPVGSALDAIARARQSTVYMPGRKITMLPESVIEQYTLKAGATVPAVSFYFEMEPDLVVSGMQTKVEAVRIADNLRHDTLDPVFNEESVRTRKVQHPIGADLLVLHDFALRREAERGRADTGREPRPEYSFRVDGERIDIVERRRGSPIDKVVAELMILVNAEWGRAIDQRGWPGVFRVQQEGRVRMSSVASPHQGLGVTHYVWASSPLRRYVDLMNQRQIIALARDEAPVYARNSDVLFSAIREFELAYEAYGEFQRSMERYWCLRWIRQEGVTTLCATVIRENLVRLERLPLVLRVPSAPDLPSGTRVELEVCGIDLLDLTLDCEFRQRLAA